MTWFMSWLDSLDRTIGRLVAAAQWLALPLVALLFLQWPLRDLIHCCSRDANDLGQWIFALYVAVSMTAATRAGTHLSADLLAQRYSARARARLNRIGMIVAILPWTLFLLFTSRDLVWNSVRGLEAFPDTFNPGYFIIKLALWLIAVLALAQALVEIFRPLPGEAR
jgi:TRAP-type mannitol/chloroaromatic compound transport system permease small subunit